MSIFGSIVSAIFGKHAPGTTAATGSTTTSTASPGTTSTASTGSAPLPGATPGKPMTREEVNAMIQKAVGAQHEDLDWKRSIVDLMKVLKLDSSLAARKELAQELGYKGALNGSAEMNIWLHDQVMTKLAEGGGKMPDIKKA
jgi:Domain of unknown function (DUF3597)